MKDKRKELPSIVPRLAVRVAFVLTVVRVAWDLPAWDLTATYVAGRLVASGQVASLYDQTRENSAKQLGSAWARAAELGGITDRVVTPYIQTPLWAWLVAWPASHLGFDAFKRILAGLSATATACMVALAARHWASSVTGQHWQAALLFGLFLTVPFDAGLLLGQTHLLFLYLATAASVRAIQGRDASAGCLLAIACAVKITPGWVALAWLVAGRFRAVGSFIAASCLLAGLSVATTGRAAFADYLHTLAWLGRSVALSYNDDSLATVLMHRSLTPDAAFAFQPTVLPGWVAALSVAATASCAIAAGLLDRRAAEPAGQHGAIITLVAATACAPLAWNHYYVVLVLPVILFLSASRDRAAWLAASCVVLALLMPPLAATPSASLTTISWRSEFWAAALCVAGLVRLRGKPSQCATAA